jgi:hypothetical protein
MPNALLIEELFGSSSAIDRTDVLIIDGSRTHFSMDDEIEKLKAIQQQHNSFPNLYLCRVDEKTFDNNFKALFSTGTFTILGLESITKAALRKILNSLPSTVTTLGLDSLSSQSADYLCTFLKRQSRKLTIFYGEYVSNKESIVNVCESFLPQSIESKKRKSSTYQIIMDSLTARTSAADKKPRMETSADLIIRLHNENGKLLKAMKDMAEVLDKDPQMVNIFDLQQKLAEAEEKIESLTTRNCRLASENTSANTQISILESFRLTSAPITMASAIPSLEDDKHFTPTSSSQLVPFLTYPTTTSLADTFSSSPCMPMPPDDEQVRNARDILSGLQSGSRAQTSFSSSSQFSYPRSHSIYSPSSPPPLPQLLSAFPPVLPLWEGQTSNSGLSFLRRNI